VCTPSRSSFLTGRYPRTTRCRQNGQNIPDQEVLITRLLKEKGYSCGLSGKLHLSSCNPQVCQEQERRINDGYDTFYWSHDAGKGWAEHNQYWAWLAENNVPFQSHVHPDCKWVSVAMPAQWHQTTWCVDKAISFIREHAKKKLPWLFSVNIFDPHHPFDAPEEYLERYQTILNEISLPQYQEGELVGKPPLQQYDHDKAYGHLLDYVYEEMQERDHQMIRVSYWSMCDLIDSQVGRLLDILRETGQDKNTIVIYMSDHGEMLGDHGLYLKGPYFYEPAVRVPFIISLPGIIQAQRIDSLVELTDVAQTLLEALHIPHHPGMQGKSFWQMLTNKKDNQPHRENIYCEYYNAQPWHRNPTAHQTMLRTEQYKLVVDHNYDTGELYNLKEDPGEVHNLWKDTEIKDIKSDLLLQLCHRMAWTADPLPERSASW
jgi:arylsulfatase A-like enzyme